MSIAHIGSFVNIFLDGVELREKNSLQLSALLLAEYVNCRQTVHFPAWEVHFWSLRVDKSYK